MHTSNMTEKNTNYPELFRNIYWVSLEKKTKPELEIVLLDGSINNIPDDLKIKNKFKCKYLI